MAGTKCMERHNTVGRYLHWWICKDRGMVVSEEWYKHMPQASTDIGDTTVMWDIKVRTDKHIRCNKLNIIMHDKKNKTCQIIDAAIPLDQNINLKTAEKLTKYKELQQELTCMYMLKETEIIPIVIDALGTVTQGLLKYVQKVSQNANADTIIKYALLGTAHIIRNFLM